MLPGQVANGDNLRGGVGGRGLFDLQYNNSMLCVLNRLSEVHTTYSITSMARTRMARLQWMIRTRFSVPTKYFQ